MSGDSKESLEKAIQGARYAVDELRRVGDERGWQRYYFAIAADRSGLSGTPLRLITEHESMVLTCGLVACLHKHPLLLLGRHDVQITDTTPADHMQDYDDSSPITSIRAWIYLHAGQGSILASTLAWIDLDGDPEGPDRLLIGALGRPPGWPP